MSLVMAEGGRPLAHGLNLFDRDAVRYELAERNLRDFTKQAWRWVDPADYLTNWHIDCISDHLEAVARREIPNGIIFNIPPRHMKSLSVNVMFPAWVWCQNPDPLGLGHGKQVRPGTWLGPGTRFLSASYAVRLAIRDNVKCRRIVESPWYTKKWGERVFFTPDQNTKAFYENAQGGARYATAVDAAVTGEGGDIDIIDDPINVSDSNSPTAIENVITWWSESMPTRLNDAKHGVFVIVMQRCNENDLTGYILAKELGFVHVCIPARFESDHPFPFHSPLFGKKAPDGRDYVAADPRKDGELLWTARVGEPEFAKLSLSLGIYGTAGQLQQRPSPREGGLFERGWFEVLPAPPARRRIVRRWDLAASVPKPGTDPAFSAGVKVSLDDDGFFYVEHVNRFQKDPDGVERELKTTASQDGKKCFVRIAKDPAQAGKWQIQYLVRQLRGYRVEGKPEHGSKLQRADPVAAQAKAGNIFLIQDKEGDRWIDAFLDELQNFPNGKHKDQVDALSGAVEDLLNLPPALGQKSVDW